MPGERDPIERARLLREAEEKRAVRRHGAWESEPPLSPGFPSPPIQGRPGDGNPHYNPHDVNLASTERHARWIDAIKKIVGGLIFVGSILFAGLTWMWNRAQLVVIESMSQRMDPMCIRPTPPPILPGQSTPVPPPGLSERFTKLEDSIAKLSKVTEDGTDPQSLLGKRLDSLDKILQKQFGESTTSTAPPKMGPTAHKKGQQ